LLLKKTKRILRKKGIPMESTKSSKRIIKKRLENVDKAIVENALMKFKNFKGKKKN
tara:strand:- start:209 stop:376 length:168 start_codon:yes stop_codon:yes gene_type:complete